MTRTRPVRRRERSLCLENLEDRRTPSVLPITAALSTVGSITHLLDDGAKVGLATPAQLLQVVQEQLAGILASVAGAATGVVDDIIAPVEQLVDDVQKKANDTGGDEGPTHGEIVREVARSLVAGDDTGGSHGEAVREVARPLDSILEPVRPTLTELPSPIGNIFNENPGSSDPGGGDVDIIDVIDDVTTPNLPPIQEIVETGPGVITPEEPTSPTPTTPTPTATDTTATDTTATDPTATAPTGPGSDAVAAITPSGATPNPGAIGNDTPASTILTPTLQAVPEVGVLSTSTATRATSDTGPLLSPETATLPAVVFAVGTEDAQRVYGPLAIDEGALAEEEAGLEGADLAAGVVNINLAALDAALQQFLSNADAMARAAGNTLGGSAWWAWMLAALAASGAALEVRRRRRKLGQPALASDGGTDAVSTLSWMPGMPGSYSDEDE